MRVPRIYYPGKLNVDAMVALNSAASHHLLRVLRMEVGNKIILFNGEGGQFHGVITTTTSKQTQVCLQNFEDMTSESTLQIHLLQGISRGEKMDFIIQKAVELGVSAISPIFTEFGNVKLDEERSEKRIQHWQQIIISACEQSGRTKIPILNKILNFKDAIAQGSEQIKFILQPRANKRLTDQHSIPSTVALLIGAEGGFSNAEINFALQHKFTELELGPRILRTETAGLAAIAVLQARWGDLN